MAVLSPRVAARRNGHWIVEVSLTRAQSRLGGFSIRAASGVLPSGSFVTLSDADGNDYEYMPILAGEVSMPQGISMQPASVQLSMHWFLPPGIVPFDLDLDNAYGRIGRVHETADGSAIEETQEQVVWEVASLLRGVSSGDETQQLRFTLQAQGFTDGGTIWPRTQSLTDARFADIALTTASSANPNPRAKNAADIYPPIAICPASTQTALDLPLTVVVDEAVNYDGAHTYAQRRLLASYETLPTGTYSLYLMGKNAGEAVGLAGETQQIAGYTGLSLTAGTDLLGDAYQYVDGLLEETTTAAGLIFVAGNAAVTGATGDNISQFGAGDQIKKTGDVLADVAPIKSVDGGTVTLQTVYGGVNGTTTGVVTRLTNDQATAGFLQVGASGLGGIKTPDARTLSNPGDFLLWLFRRSIPNYRYHTGDLANIVSRTQGWWISTVLSATAGDGNVSPWAYAMDHIFSWLPVVPYLDRSHVRFLWDGWVPKSAAETIIDLDADNSGIVRTDLVSRGLWGLGSSDAGANDDPIVNFVSLGYRWSIRRQRYIKRVLLGGYAEHSSVYNACGRSVESQARYETIDGQPPVAQRGEISIDTIGDLSTAGLAAIHYLLRFAQRRRRMALNMPAEYGWIQLGSIVEIREASTVGTSQLWRMVSRLLQQSGSVRAVFESIPE